MRAAVLTLTLALAGCLGPDLASNLESHTHQVVRSSDPVTLPNRDFAPPPISGGTLLALKDGVTVVAADPDTDMLWRLNLNDSSSLVGLPLDVGDEPGRLIEDASGRVHVVLRRAGAIATVDVKSADPALIYRREACTGPRGIAYDPGADRIHVACEDGQLVSFAAGGGEAVSRLRLDDDLRDVSVVPGGFVVSRFHSAELLVLDASGTVVSRASQPNVTVTPFFGFDGGMPATPRTFGPGVAWRMLQTPQGTVMTFQLAQMTPIALSTSTGPGGPDAGFGGSAYGGSGCEPGVVESVVTLPVVGESVQLPGALPVDVAVGTSEAMIVSAGSNTVTTIPLVPMPPNPPGACGGMSPFLRIEMTLSQPVAVAIQNDIRVVQLRDPGALTWNGNRVLFPVRGRTDLGHARFHTQAPAGLACASCHPEGREDGRVWNFSPDGPRRTQNVSGGVLATAPFHWDGAFSSLEALMSEVLVRRMGADPSDIQPTLGAWLDKVPRASARGAGGAAAARGKELFESYATGCTSCHSGERFTNNLSFDVGTGGRFQVPSLTGVSARAPYMHDGCAKTLEDRFGPCGGTAHGTTAQLTTAQISDLVAYLKTL